MAQLVERLLLTPEILQFESSHCQNLFTIKCAEKTKIMKRRSRMTQLLQQFISKHINCSVVTLTQASSKIQQRSPSNRKEKHKKLKINFASAPALRAKHPCQQIEKILLQGHHKDCNKDDEGADDARPQGYVSKPNYLGLKQCLYES